MRLAVERVALRLRRPLRTAWGELAERELLLVELEDLNPYLSLDRVGPATRDRFVEAMTDSLLRLAAS